MHTLRLIHRWIGLVVAIPIVLVSVSGGLLVLRDPYYRMRWPVLAQPATEAEHALQPRVLERIETTFGDTLRIIKFPREGVNAFHVYLTHEREGFVDPRTGQVRQATASDRPPNTKSLGRVNELGTLFCTLAGMLNLIAIIDASTRRGRRSAGGGL